MRSSIVCSSTPKFWRDSVANTKVILASALAAAALLPTSASAANNPGRTCAEAGNMELASRGACASSVARGELSTAAYVANCKTLEPDFAAQNATGRPYPYSFYGNPAYTANNRSDCVLFLRAFHTGQLPPGPGA
jgi:hypothetical protein